MSSRLTCPGCGRFLLLPGDCTAEKLTCPRCLADIANPQAPDASSGVQTGAPAARPSTPAPSAVTPRVEWTRGVDGDVRRDSRGTSGCLVLLATLGGIGVVSLAWLSLAIGAQAVIFTLIALLVLTVISVAWVARHPREEAEGSVASRTVFGVLVISGTIMLLVIAVLIFFLVVCMMNPPHWGR
jgi:hypothetical protein